MRTFNFTHLWRKSTWLGLGIYVLFSEQTGREEESSGESTHKWVARGWASEKWLSTITLAPRNEVIAGPLEYMISVSSLLFSAGSGRLLFRILCDRPLFLAVGVNTCDIITLYISAIKALRVLDPSMVILEVACEPIRRYLR